MDKLEQLKHILKEKVDNSRDPILAWSGGKDSTLLLGLLLQMGYKLPILSFPHFWNEYQKEFIKYMVDKYKLTCFYYSPKNLHFNNKWISVEYIVGEISLPVIMDWHPSRKYCGIDIGNKALKERNLQPTYLWDVTIVGTKSEDRHEAIENYQFNALRTYTHFFYEPLWNWSDEEVLSSLEKEGIEFDKRWPINHDIEADTGSFNACMNCISTEKECYCFKVDSLIKGVNYVEKLS